MSNVSFDVDFIWAKDLRGFHFSGEVDVNVWEVTEARIVRNGGALQNYEPAKVAGLFQRFLRLKTPADLLSFINLYGPLTREGFVYDGTLDFNEPENSFNLYAEDGEELEISLEYASWFRDIVAEKHRPARIADMFRKFNFEKYQVQLEPDSKRGIRFKYFPESLLDLLSLQLAHLVLDLPSYSPCLMCGEFFAKGVGTNRRGDAEFCCDQHRINYNSQKRSRK